MRAWLSRIGGRRAVLVAAAIAAVAVVAAVVLLVTTGGDDSEPAPTSTRQGPGSSKSTAAPEDEVPSAAPSQTQSPPSRDRYCPAFQEIRAGGLTAGTDEDDDEAGVDLAGLSRTFDDLVGKYEKAERVSPLSLRDDYAKALGFLREGKKATASGDEELLRALVLNLETLNASMSTIETKSAAYCG